ncbi:MAG: helix-turn-helix transcriptional regulator [Acidobacteriota bacterium]
MESPLEIWSPELVRQIRADLNLTQREVADRCHMKVATYKRIEAGRGDATTAQASAIMNALGGRLVCEVPAELAAMRRALAGARDAGSAKARLDALIKEEVERSAPGDDQYEELRARIEQLERKIEESERQAI